jgi:hypothetical protein
MKRFLIVRVKGGLGNQLFILANSILLSKKFEFKLIIDDITGYKKDKFNRDYLLDNIIDNFNGIKFISKENTLYKFIFREVLFLFSKLKICNKYYIKNEVIDFSSIGNDSCKATIYVDNYFQNINLFKDPNLNSNFLIKNNFRIQLSKFDGITKQYKKNDEFYNKNAIVHLRFYSNIPLDKHNFDQKIYTEKLRDLVNKGNIEKIYLVTNSFEMIDWMKWSSLPVIIVDLPDDSNNALDLLAFISSFDYFFGSFSTFSWWGAYLSNSAAEIYFPGLFRADDVEKWFTSLYMSDWKLLV